ncbi:MAG TPA: class I SAM-dependent methyltransferase [Phenylobacterium sp.]
MVGSRTKLALVVVPGRLSTCMTGAVKLLSAASRSPDAHAEGLVSSGTEALRYDQGTSVIKEDPYEVPGIVRSWMPEHVRVLDVGCGAGALTLRTTRDKNNVVVGVEPDATRADVARSRGLDVVWGALDDRFVEAQKPFDVILFSDVIEHVAAPSQILALATRILARDGSIIASVPNVAHWTVRLRLLFGRFDYTSVGIMDATHLRWFTQRSLRRLFEACGLQVTDVTVAAGTWMPEYARFPFTLLPDRLRKFAVHRLTAMFPTLFGCQIVIRAVRAPASPPASGSQRR